MQWRIFHKEETASTNTDAKSGVPFDVFTADYQTAGRGRLDHKWLSKASENLMMSAVLDVADMPIEEAATLPLAVGLAVADSVKIFLGPKSEVSIKWPNDIYVSGKKICGILCERSGDNAIAGIGINVRQDKFPNEIADRATSFAILGVNLNVAEVRDATLKSLADVYSQWKEGGFKSIYQRISAVDWLKGRNVSVRRTDNDGQPATGLCGGIANDGSLLVNGEHIWAGEANN